jgi:hypothetical protein
MQFMQTTVARGPAVPVRRPVAGRPVDLARSGAGGKGDRELGHGQITASTYPIGPAAGRSTPAGFHPTDTEFAYAGGNGDERSVLLA